MGGKMGTKRDSKALKWEYSSDQIEWLNGYIYIYVCIYIYIYTVYTTYNQHIRTLCLDSLEMGYYMLSSGEFGGSSSELGVSIPAIWSQGTNKSFPTIWWWLILFE
jgi:hypothetical protein